MCNERGCGWTVHGQDACRSGGGKLAPLQHGKGHVPAICDGVRERSLPTWLKKRSFYLKKEKRAHSSYVGIHHKKCIFPYPDWQDSHIQFPIAVHGLASVSPSEETHTNSGPSCLLRESRGGRWGRGRSIRLHLGPMAVEAVTQGVACVLKAGLASRHKVKEVWRVSGAEEKIT